MYHGDGEFDTFFNFPVPVIRGKDAPIWRRDGRNSRENDATSLNLRELQCHPAIHHGNQNNKHNRCHQCHPSNTHYLTSNGQGYPN